MAVLWQCARVACTAGSQAEPASGFAWMCRPAEGGYPLTDASVSTGRHMRLGITRLHISVTR